ncbi:integrase core domain-containing protein [Nonomuraea sp. NPDC050153]|uniref:integrase core domain-containing protein n=1 Tax=Nonomuraea sp. NPDC050153 TaxID=3364359 RepID=UPI0037A076EB
MTRHPTERPTTWADFLRAQAEALLACDFIETVTLTGQRQYILAVIEHASRRVRVLGTTAHPTASWIVQAMKNLVMDLEEVGCRVRFLIRDRDGKFPALMDEILAEAGIRTVLTGIRMPLVNAVMERWVQSCRRELLDRCLLWNERHLRYALCEYERFYNRHRAHQALDQAAPLRAVPDPIRDPTRIAELSVRRRADSAGSSTGTHMPLELHGCSFRQAQGAQVTYLLQTGQTTATPSC